jgi:hypothetical protein
MNMPVYRTVIVLLVAVMAFNLGRYSVEYSGSWAASTAVVGFGAGLILGVALLVHNFWKSNA